MANPKSSMEIAHHPLHPMIIPFPIAFLIGTFASDIVYAATSANFWAQASYWLLIAALVTGGIAALVGLTDFLGEGRIRQQRAAWYHMIGNVIVVLLSIANLWLRIDSGVGPGAASGIWISLVVTLLLLFTGWEGGELVYRHHVAVSDDSERLQPGE